MTNNRIQIGDRVTIFPRGKTGTYTADFWQGSEHRRKSLKTRNVKVARQRALRLELQLATGEFTSLPKPKTITEATDDYIRYLETEGRRRKTTVRYRGILKVFQQFAASADVELLQQVSPVLIDAYRAGRKKLLAPKSMRNEGVLLKSFFRWCQQRRLITENPLQHMTFPKPIPKRRGGPSLAQINRILSTAKGLRRIQFAVLAFTGMRSGELQRLKPEDVDLRSNWIHVVSRDGLETKTGHSRSIPIHPRLRPFLSNMPTRTREWFFTAAPSQKYPDGNHHISTKHLNEDLLKLLTHIGLRSGREDGFTVHSFRHSFEALCVNAGIPQRVIDTWLGHRSDTSMANIYYRLSDDES